MAKWGEIKCPRCEELEAKLREQIEWVRRLADDLIAAEGREARLKEKLAKALEALKIYADPCEATQTTPCGYEGSLCCKTARTTLAELKGQDDE